VRIHPQELSQLSLGLEPQLLLELAECGGSVEGVHRLEELIGHQRLDRRAVVGDAFLHQYRDHLLAVRGQRL